MLRENEAKPRHACRNMSYGVSQSIHQSTGYTPFNLKLGREMKLPLDIMIFVYNLHCTVTLPLNLIEAFKHVREKLQRAQYRQKDYYDRGIKDCFFQPGDRVSYTIPL